MDRATEVMRTVLAYRYRRGDSGRSVRGRRRFTRISGEPVAELVGAPAPSVARYGVVYTINAAPVTSGAIGTVAATMCKGESGDRIRVRTITITAPR